jgi:hypothetical protein
MNHSRSFPFRKILIVDLKETWVGLDWAYNRCGRLAGAVHGSEDLNGRPLACVRGYKRYFWTCGLYLCEKDGTEPNALDRTWSCSECSCIGASNNQELPARMKRL